MKPCRAQVIQWAVRSGTIGSSRELALGAAERLEHFATLAYAAGQASKSEWRPIESAPKDVFLLLSGPSGYTTTPTVFTTGRMCRDYHEGRWIDHAGDDLTDWGFEPTHWMPLPAVPSQETGK